MDKEVELVVEIGDEINLTADTRMCKQMLANLVSNAIKFTPAGGQVKIATTLNHNGELALTVVDTGIGMTSGGVDRAFEKFGQVAGGFNRLHTGTGLGLPLVAEQIALHGGTVAASSTVGKGTTMTLVFPASRVSLGRQGSLF